MNKIIRPTAHGLIAGALAVGALPTLNDPALATEYHLQPYTKSHSEFVREKISLSASLRQLEDQIVKSFQSLGLRQHRLDAEIEEDILSDVEGLY